MQVSRTNRDFCSQTLGVVGNLYRLAKTEPVGTYVPVATCVTVLPASWRVDSDCCSDAAL